MTSPNFYGMTSPDFYGMTSPDLVELDDNVDQRSHNVPCLADGAATVLAPPSSITRGHSIGKEDVEAVVLEIHRRKSQFES